MSELSLPVLLAHLKLEFPDFKIVPKTQSRLMMWIGMFLWVLGNKKFMTEYVTTIGTTVYVHSLWDQKQDVHKALVLRHERIHMRQAKRYGLFWFSFLYLLVFFPLGLAWFRAHFEKEAYKETMRGTYWLGGTYALTNPTFKAFILSQFLTPAYGWMWPFRKSMELWYDETVADILIEEARPAARS
jgi:hypothetical protein